MKLPQFLNCVDENVNNSNHAKLAAFIHEIARKLPEEKREDFLSFLQNIDDESINNDGKNEVIKQIEETITKLDKISQGEVTLDSEFNEEYDDWYNPDADEYIFYDRDRLLVDINKAICLIHQSVDMDLFDKGYQLCERLLKLEVNSTGDYFELYSSSLTLKQLYQHELICVDYPELKKECIYLAYMANNISNRAENMYNFFNYFNDNELSLDEIAKMGNHELINFNEFLPLWIDYLGNKTDHCTSKLLNEALLMVNDNEVLLNTARKFKDDHPELYLQLLELNKDNDLDEKMLDIGLEAINVLSNEMLIRSKIALLTAYYADKLSKTAIKENCWLEAFKSDTSITNYMRLKFLTQDFTTFQQSIIETIEYVYSKSSSTKGLYYNEYKLTNELSTFEYCVMMFFEQQFDKMANEGMAKRSDGYSYCFMDEGLAFLMLLLYYGNDFPKGMQRMLTIARYACRIHKKDLYCGTTINNDLSDEDIFTDFFTRWKNSVNLSYNKQDVWLNKIEMWIAKKIEIVMNNSKYNYYEVCAAFISAFGEVKESLGQFNEKQKIMMDYRNKYSRKRKFIGELIKYGMVK